MTDPRKVPLGVEEPKAQKVNYGLGVNSGSTDYRGKYDTAGIRKDIELHCMGSSGAVNVRKSK